MKEFLHKAGRVCVVLYIVLSLVVILKKFSTDDALQLLDASSPTPPGTFDAVPEEEVKVKEEETSSVKTEFVDPEDEYFLQMKEKMDQLERSSNQQRKFLSRKSRIETQFDQRIRFKSKPGEYAAIPISDQFAFLHIWKCGGTTISEQLGPTSQFELSAPVIQNKDWVALVRDPIDRFLSAWAECGFRQYKGTIAFGGFEEHTVLSWVDEDYDFRIRAFLNEVHDFIYPVVWGSCHTHAHPQANFMINSKGHIDPHIKIVGDLSELESVVKMAGFNDYMDEVVGRDASANNIKQTYFPSRRDLLSDQTILELCQFLALDYFLFDFDPPAICMTSGAPLATFY